MKIAEQLLQDSLKLGVMEIKLKRLQALVDKQAEDEQLWLGAYAEPIDKLRNALRDLHALIEE